MVMIDLDDEDLPPATIPAGGSRQTETDRDRQTETDRQRGSSSASKHGEHDRSAGSSAMWDRIADGADTRIKTPGASRTIHDVL